MGIYNCREHGVYKIIITCIFLRTGKNGIFGGIFNSIVIIV